MSYVTTDSSAQLGQTLSHRCGQHMAQVERRVEQEQQLVLEAFESVAVIVGVDGDQEVLAHPPGKRLFGRGVRTIGALTCTSSRSKRMAARVQRKVDIRTLPPRCIWPMRLPSVLSPDFPEGHLVAPAWPA